MCVCVHKAAQDVAMWEQEGEEAPPPCLSPLLSPQPIKAHRMGIERDLTGIYPRLRPPVQDPLVRNFVHQQIIFSLVLIM